MDALYDSDRERLYLLAARDFLEAGRRAPALGLLLRARAAGHLGMEGHKLLASLSQTEEKNNPGVCAECGRNSPLPCLCGLEGPACS